jgi:hypothetical protein
MPPGSRRLLLVDCSLAAVLAFTAACGSGQPTPTVSATTTATTTVTATATATVTVTAQSASQAAQYVVAPESCGALSYGADGNVSPPTCPDGRPNLAADKYLRGMHLRVMALGANADPGQVLAAMCKDMAQSTIPIETTAYQVAAAEQRWSFGIDPADELVNGC